MTKRIAIAELEGVALDWAVAEAEGLERIESQPPLIRHWLDQYGTPMSGTWCPTEDWSQCGPLMDEHLYRIDKPVNGDKCWAQTHDMKTIQGGPNRLIAACRAIVAAQNPSGFVDVPDELVEGE
ncbi:phage protein NinX family protein [Alcanivorax sp. DP30]|uniref:phage protein NinX family protein n=1 Tax=Alcanivorax sp. DP30 TaxID=2606217 RepID=UPI00136D9C44|nr:phage protein NinX family protein [Alcanivorax sp. DP30]MZR63816.1 DUF2591 domain-containing protein [Alcanivorax sp. DP30]